MDKKELLDELETLKKDLETSLEAKADAKIEAKLAALNTGIDELKAQKPEVTAEEIKEIKSDLFATIRAFDLFQAKGAFGTVKPQGEKSFKDELGEQLEKRKNDLVGYKSNDRKAFGFEIKAVGNMSAANTTISGTTTFQGANMLGVVGRKPYETVHIRDVMRVQAITSDSAYVIRDNFGEGGPAVVAPGGAKPQSDRDYVKLIQPVTKIAHYFKLPEEMLGDIPWLQNEITAVGVEDLLAKEDDLVLNQVAGAGLFAGLTTATNSTAFAAPASLALGVETPNNYDALVAAWTQLMTLKGRANYVLVNPADYAAMILSKATDGQYVFGAPNIAIPNIFGIPMIPHNAIGLDKFLLGDFNQAYIGQREGVSVRFYDQNEDDAIKNMVTVVIEERLTVIANRADKIIYGDFSDAKTALTAP